MYTREPRSSPNVCVKSVESPRGGLRLEVLGLISDYGEYVRRYGILEAVGLPQEAAQAASSKVTKGVWDDLSPDISEPFEPELDDLARLHWLVVSRRVLTALEFGVGFSTRVIDLALELNQVEHSSATGNLRILRPFELFSVDNQQVWIERVSHTFDLLRTTLWHSDVEMSTFNERVCTTYANLPNISPDFIYLDGPDQFSPRGHIRGLSTASPDRLPMSADILAFEHFLLPGTLIVVDGRTANARFLRSNLQRRWSYQHVPEWDQHFFELREEPLGVWNERQIDFSLGPEYYRRLGNLDLPTVAV